MKTFLTLLLTLLSFTGYAANPRFENLEEESNYSEQGLFSWKRYKANFGMEKIYLRFPKQPLIVENGTHLGGYCYYYNVLYSFYGFYPPLGNINSGAYFQQILNDASTYPFSLLWSSSYETADGYWILDYTAHDGRSDCVVKSRTVVTPFNSYSLQTIIPRGCKDQFEYFLDSFRIHCECNR